MFSLPFHDDDYDDDFNDDTDDCSDDDESISGDFTAPVYAKMLIQESTRIVASKRSHALPEWIDRIFETQMKPLERFLRQPPLPTNPHLFRHDEPSVWLDRIAVLFRSLSPPHFRAPAETHPAKPIVRKFFALFPQMLDKFAADSGVLLSLYVCLRFVVSSAGTKILFQEFSVHKELTRTYAATRHFSLVSMATSMLRAERPTGSTANASYYVEIMDGFAPVVKRTLTEIRNDDSPKGNLEMSSVSDFFDFSLNLMLKFPLQFARRPTLEAVVRSAVDALRQCCSKGIIDDDDDDDEEDDDDDIINNNNNAFGTTQQILVLFKRILILANLRLEDAREEKREEVFSLVEILWRLLFDEDQMALMLHGTISALASAMAPSLALRSRIAEVLLGMKSISKPHFLSCWRRLKMASIPWTSESRDEGADVSDECPPSTWFTVSLSPRTDAAASNHDARNSDAASSHKCDANDADGEATPAAIPPAPVDCETSEAASKWANSLSPPPAKRRRIETAAATEAAPATAAAEAAPSWRVRIVSPRRFDYLYDDDDEDDDESSRPKSGAEIMKAFCRDLLSAPCKPKVVGAVGRFRRRIEFSLERRIL